MTRVVSLDLEANPYHTPQPVKIALSGNLCLVPACNYLAGDGYVCPSCVEAWEVHLGNVAAMVEDLNVAEQKRVRFGQSGSSGGSTPTPERQIAGIPVDRDERILFADPRKVAPADEQTVGPGNKEAGGQGITLTAWMARSTPSNRTAAQALVALNNELVGQIRTICESGHIKVPELEGPVPMSRWLLRQSLRLPKMPEQEGPGLVHDLDTMMRDCLGVIDAPTRRKYVRECECGLAVWANPEHDKARCACGREYVTDDEYEARMLLARDAWVTIDEAHDGSGVKVDTIKKWIARGRGGKFLPTSGSEPRRVRFGDVLDWAEAAKEKIA